MMMQIVGAFAEFERAMLRERTRNGLDAARKEGRVGGRHPKLKTHQPRRSCTWSILDRRPQRMPPDYQRSSRYRVASPAGCQGALTGFYVPLRPKPQPQESFDSVNSAIHIRLVSFGA